MALKNTWPAVMATETTTEFRRYSQKFSAAPEPPSAWASSTVLSPRTRLKAPQVKSAGRNDEAWLASARLLDSAVRSIQYMGNSVMRIASSMITRPTKWWRLKPRLPPGVVSSASTADTSVTTDMSALTPSGQVGLAGPQQLELRERDAGKDHEEHGGDRSGVAEVR